MLTAESQKDEFHAAKTQKTKDKYIDISYFKSYVPPILGGSGEGKESTTPLTAICTPEIWNAHNGVRGVYPRSSKYLQYQSLNLDAGINSYLGHHMESRLMASKYLENKLCYGINWSLR